MSFTRSEDVIRFFADEELAGTVEDKFIAVSLDFATILSSSFCHAGIFSNFSILFQLQPSHPVFLMLEALE